MLGFLKCVVEAIAANGVQGLLQMVPGGEYVFKVGEDAIKRYRERNARAKIEDEIKEMIVARADEALAVAKKAVEEAAPELPPREKELVLQYVSAIPESARQSLKRKDDPTGTSLPFGYTIHEPAEVVQLLPQFPPRFVPGEWVPGRKDNWRLERRLGGGGFGEVWLARHSFKRTEKPRAVKFCTDRTARQRLVTHEKQVIERVMERVGDHANVVSLLECHLEGETPWLMYEFVEGGTLADVILAWQTLGPADRLLNAVTTLRQIAGAVGFCHAMDPPIVHRDLKPANVLVDRGVPRITDFGIGGTAVDYLIAEDRSRGYVSVTGRLPSQLSGSYSLLYSSPQQRNGERPDPRDDVHALGVIAYQMLTGDLTAAPGFDLSDDLRDAGAPDAFIALVGKSVAQKAERRPKDAREWEAALAALLPGKVATEPTRVDPVPVPTSAPPVVARTQKWQINVAGTWSRRPTGAKDAEWEEIGKTPAEVTCEAGFDHCLEVQKDASDVMLAGLAVLFDFPNPLDLLLVGCEQLTDTGVAHVKSLHNLYQLNLGSCERLTDTSLTYLKGLTNLQDLGLAHCSWLTDVGLAQLKHLPKLQWLNLNGCEQITDRDLAHLKELTSLRELLLHRCKLTGAGLAHLKGLTNLQKLSLWDCKQLTDAGLAHLKELTNLQELNLWDCKQLTDAGLAHLKEVTSLQMLYLKGSEQLTDVGLMHIKGLTNLQKLDLGDCKQLTDVGMAHLKGLAKLQELNLSESEQVTDAGLVHLKGLAKLQSLKLRKCKWLTDVGLAYLTGLTNLQVLDLWNCERLTDTGLVHLKGLSNLRELDLGWCKRLTDTGLVHLKGLSNLRELDLGLCERLTDAGLAHLKGLTNLRKLDLRSCELTDAGLAHLKGLTNLRELDLRSCERLTDAGLAYLKGLTSLQELNLWDCKLLTDTGLAHLKELTNLQKLCLWNCEQLTDAGLAYLKGVISLQELDLTGCEQLTDAGVASLQQALPWLVVNRY